MDWIGLALIAVWALAVAEGVAIFALARAIGVLQIHMGGEPRALRTSEGLTIGAEAPSLSPQSDDVPARPRVAIFIAAGCSTCRFLLKEVRRIRRLLGEEWELTIVVQGTRHQLNLVSRDLSDSSLRLDPQGVVTGRYQVESTPFVYLIREGRISEKGLVNSIEHLESLLDHQVVDSPSWKIRSVDEAPTLANVEERT